MSNGYVMVSASLPRFLSGEMAVKVGSCDHVEHPVTEFGQAKSHTKVSPTMGILGNSPAGLPTALETVWALGRSFPGEFGETQVGALTVL